MADIFPPDLSRRIRDPYRQIQDFKPTPLFRLSNLSRAIGLEDIWVKDESQRLSLKSFKIMGASYAMYQFIAGRLGVRDWSLPISDRDKIDLRKRLDDPVFAAATDGNHGKAVEWFAKCLGLRSIIYVPGGTTQARIDAIEACGGNVIIVDGTYDDSVRKINRDAAFSGWHVISDTSSGGEQKCPR
ncbi:pyridoxal-phosphate dependent enzyme [bacterium]|nr:pyridoxal-phosphate dependent enzyme [candidate division CSSED10-310 bacterium]